MSFIIWGLTKGQSESNFDVEKQLHTKSSTIQEATENMKMLANKHGCHSMRVQIVETTTPPVIATKQPIQTETQPEQTEWGIESQSSKQTKQIETQPKQTDNNLWGIEPQSSSATSDLKNNNSFIPDSVVGVSIDVGIKLFGVGVSTGTGVDLTESGIKLFLFFRSDVSEED
jgi:hypothetical protein